MEELNVPYELKIYHRKKNLMAPDELKKIHPLGKSPVITIGDQVIAESAFIIQYLCDHFAGGKTLVPERWKPGQENKLGGETEAWMRYQYTMYFAEGSFMPYLVFYLIFSSMRFPQIDIFLPTCCFSCALAIILTACRVKGARHSILGSTNLARYRQQRHQHIGVSQREAESEST
jgi:hypothetical protein